MIIIILLFYIILSLYYRGSNKEHNWQVFKYRTPHHQQMKEHKASAQGCSGSEASRSTNATGSYSHAYQKHLKEQKKQIMVQAHLETVKHQTTTTPTVGGQHQSNLVMQGLLLQNEKQTSSLNKRRHHQNTAVGPSSSSQQTCLNQINSQSSVENIIPSRNDVSLLYFYS